MTRKEIKEWCWHMWPETWRAEYKRIIKALKVQP